MRSRDVARSPVFPDAAERPSRPGPGGQAWPPGSAAGFLPGLERRAARSRTEAAGGRRPPGPGAMAGRTGWYAVSRPCGRRGSASPPGPDGALRPVSPGGPGHRSAPARRSAPAQSAPARSAAAPPVFLMRLGLLPDPERSVAAARSSSPRGRPLGSGPPRAMCRSRPGEWSCPPAPRRPYRCRPGLWWLPVPRCRPGLPWLPVPPYRPGLRRLPVPRCRPGLWWLPVPPYRPGLRRLPVPRCRREMLGPPRRGPAVPAPRRCRGSFRPQLR